MSGFDPHRKNDVAACPVQRCIARVASPAHAYRLFIQQAAGDEVADRLRQVQLTNGSENLPVHAAGRWEG
jgi:hypothetical protein